MVVRGDVPPPRQCRSALSASRCGWIPPLRPPGLVWRAHRLGPGTSHRVGTSSKPSAGGIRMRSPFLLSLALLLALVSYAGSTVAQTGPAARGRAESVPGVAELSEAERAAIVAAVEARLKGYGDALRRRD